MPAFIKTAKDEELWKKAKEISSQKFGNSKSDSFWAYTNSVFHRMKGLDESTPGFINNENDDSAWTTISEYVLKHPVYSELPECDKYSMVEEAYSKYGDQRKSEKPQELLEFMSSFGANGGWGGLGGGLGMGGGYPFSGLGGGFGGGFGMGGLGGGARTEAPKGPYVYGAAGTDQGVDPAFRTDGHPAVVVVPDQKSNYKPWEKTLDAFGNDVTDVKRAQEVTKQDDEWDGPTGDVVSALEDMGIDAEQLQHMTQEQMEDLITKAYKREQAIQSQMQTQQQVAQVPNMKNKIQEAFTFEEFNEKLDLDGKIQKARRFLTNNFRIVQAMEKESDSPKYKLGQYEIERMMRQRGLDFDENTKEWHKKKPKPVKSGAVSVPINPVVTSPETISGTQINNNPTEPVQQPVSEPVPEIPKEEPKEIDYLHDPKTKHDIKIFEARFILGMGHRAPEVTEFVQNEKTKEKTPVVPDKAVIEKLEAMKYTWNPDKLLWLDNAMTLPHIFFNNQESQKTIVARALLAALGSVEKIHVSQNGSPSSKVGTVIKDMENKNYLWNAELHHWKFIPPNPHQLNEADEKEDEPEPPKVEIPYNKVDALMMQGRYLLRAHQVDAINKTDINDRNEPKKAFAFGDPTVTKKGAQVQDSKVKQDLVDAGFTPHGLTWVDANKQNRFPDCVEKLGDDEKTFIARGVIASMTKSDQWISVEVHDIDKPIVRANGRITPEHVEEEIRVKGLEWNDKNKIYVKPEKQQNLVKTAKAARFEKEELVGLTPERQAFINRFKDANWNYMSYADREKYKEYSAERGAMRELGIDPKSWPTGEDPQSTSARKRYVRKFSQNYKFVTDPKTGTKSWVRREHPVTRALDMVGLKAAIGTVGRSLVGTTKAGVAGGGILAKALRAINKAF